MESIVGIYSERAGRLLVAHDSVSERYDLIISHPFRDESSIQAANRKLLELTGQYNYVPRKIAQLLFSEHGASYECRLMKVVDQSISPAYTRIDTDTSLCWVQPHRLRQAEVSVVLNQVIQTIYPHR